MHTDAGRRAGSEAQTLGLTALFYLNAAWQPSDGGELRLFPYPHAAVRIPPLEGRLVLFEPRMVHDVLPAHRRRYCFTLWCSVRHTPRPRAVDHATLQRMEVRPSVAEAAAVAERWRVAAGHPVVFARPCALPLSLIHI